MASPHPQLEFVDLLAEVPDSTLAVRQKKKERARALAKRRREEKQAELDALTEWADYCTALAEHQFRLGHHRACIEACRQALEIDPSLTYLAMRRVICYMDLEEFETAHDLMLDVLRDKPETAWAYGMLAAYYMRIDPDDPKVRQFMARAVEIDPGWVPGHAQLGKYAIQDGRADDALAHFKAVLAVSPAHAECHYLHISILLEMNRYAEAGEAFDQFLATADTSDPETTEFLEELQLSFAAPEN